MPATLNLSPDELLSTTRAVRKRLDFDRPVPLELVRECIEIATQAPTGSNQQGWHWMIVTDADKRKALGEIYGKAFARLPQHADLRRRDLDRRRRPRRDRSQRVASSAEYLAEHMGEAPVLVIPCIEGRIDDMPGWISGSFWGSLLPAAWSFCLAARARASARRGRPCTSCSSRRRPACSASRTTRSARARSSPSRSRRAPTSSPRPASTSTRSSTSTAGRSTEWTHCLRAPPRPRAASCRPTRASRCTTPAVERSTVDGPLLEIGSYCGKSAVYLGAAAQRRGTVLFTVDHHRGSEENQAGLGVARARSRRSRRSGGWTRCRSSAARSTTPGSKAPVVAVVGDSPTVGARTGRTPLALLFIDGGHGTEPAHRDYERWTPHVRAGRPARASTTCSPTRPTAAARRTRSTAAPLESGRFDDVERHRLAARARGRCGRVDGSDDARLARRRAADGSTASWSTNSAEAGEPPTSASAASTTDAAVYVERSPPGKWTSSGNTMPVQ